MKTSIYDLAHSKGVPIAVTKAMLAMQERIAELEGALSVQPKETPKSFAETYPAAKNPDCKCEHWQACSVCHPSLAQPVPPKELTEVQIDAGIKALLHYGPFQASSLGQRQYEGYAADVIRVYNAIIGETK